MSIGSVNNNFSRVPVLNFKGEAQAVNETGKSATAVISTAGEADKFVKTAQPNVEQKPKSSITKKIAVGCVGMCPGLGQFVNGQWLKAIGFAIGVPLADMAGFFIGGYLGLGIMVGAHLWNTIDAVINA